MCHLLRMPGRFSVSVLSSRRRAARAAPPPGPGPRPRLVIVATLNAGRARELAFPLGGVPFNVHARSPACRAPTGGAPGVDTASARCCSAD